MATRRIKLLIMDVDGTLTNGKIYLGVNGEEAKAFEVKDGCGIVHLLPKMQIKPVVVTGRCSEIVAHRCEELGIEHLYQGVSDKLAILMDLINETETELSEIAYIGDDINDLDCMTAIKAAGGVVGCPADAVREIREISDFISSKCGGNGAVRDFIEYLLSDKILNIL